jgi:hypothetical protein
MGYTTTYEGQFQLDKPLRPEHQAYLQRFSETRRMRRLTAKLRKEPDPLRLAAGLPLGRQGGYFVGSQEENGEDYDHPSVIEDSEPPQGQPWLWCHWAPTADGQALAWNGREKFYYDTEWLEYLIAHFLKPWGYILTGAVHWQGQDPSDRGTLYVANNQVICLPDAAINLVFGS